MSKSSYPKRPNPTKWKAVYIPEELVKDLEDIAVQMKLSGVGEAAAILITVGAQAMAAMSRIAPEGGEPSPELREAQVRAMEITDANRETPTTGPA